MRSLKIENGDLVFDSLGKAVFVRDLDLIVQSLNLRIKTLKEELFYNDTYGAPKLKGKQTKESIINYLKDTLMGDDRVRDIELINFESTSNSLKVDVKIYLNTNSVLFSTFNI